MIGAFSTEGQLVKLGVQYLVIINNVAGEGDYSLVKLLKAAAVRKSIYALPRQSDSLVFNELYDANKIELKLVPQGNLASHIQTTEMGLGPIYFQNTLDSVFL